MTKRITRTGKLQYSFTGEANSLRVVVVVDPDGEVISAYPASGQHGVYKNPKAPPKPPDCTNWGPRWVRPDRDQQGKGYFVWHRQNGSDAYTDILGNPTHR